MSSISFFLYRRLSQWITCEFGLSRRSKITLKNKFEVASFKDVFCHPFYWQLFHYISTPPQLVVDCGAHCGHFTILADICFRSKFSTLDTQYILIEPNPYLIPIIEKDIRDVAMQGNTRIIQGILGCEDEATLWIPTTNYLAASLTPVADAKPYSIKAANLSKIVGEQTVDLMKIDIEGGEFEFIHQHQELFKRVNLVFMELHSATSDKYDQLSDDLAQAGLFLASEPVTAHGQQLVIFQRKNNTDL